MVLLTSGACCPRIETGGGADIADEVVCSSVCGLIRTARLELGSRPAVLCLDTDAIVDGAALAMQLHRVPEEDGGEVCCRLGVRFDRKLLKSRAQTNDSPPELSLVRDGKGVVLVMGGLGGLGLVTAEALVEAGARYVVLASRSSKVSYSGQGLEERLETLRKSGAQVVLERCDTSNEKQVEALLDGVRKYGPLRSCIFRWCPSRWVSAEAELRSISACVGPKSEWCMVPPQAYIEA